MDNNKNEAILTLRQRMLKVTPLPDEPEFATSDETIVRFLKAYEWKLQDAEKALQDTVEWRRQNTPLHTQCRWCHSQPGFHSMRQVGNDESGRPVVYANFAQATAQKNTLDDIITHVTYLIENAKVTMKPGVSTWVFLIDCTGMTMSVCSPKVGLKTVNLLSAHYPERLGLIICVNHNPIFHAFWKAIKKFLTPTTASKMRLIRSESKIRQAFSNYFPEDLATWMWDEICLNKSNKSLSESQRQFWSGPPLPPVPTGGATANDSPVTRGSSTHHDPRGCPSYVENHINPFSPSRDLKYVAGERKRHCPHPNIAVTPGSNLEASILSDLATNGGGGVTSSSTPPSSTVVADGGVVVIESDGSDETPEITLPPINGDDMCDDDDDASSDEESRPHNQRHH